jgi:uncharacterized membrane protein
MISQNRQADRDRHRADEDFRTNVEAEQRIEELQKRLDAIEINKLEKIITLLKKGSSVDAPSKIQPDGSVALT